MSSPVPTPAASLAEGLSYPVHLDLRGRRVLVVGAGSVGRPQSRALGARGCGSHRRRADRRPRDRRARRRSMAPPALPARRSCGLPAGVHMHGRLRSGCASVCRRRGERRLGQLGRRHRPLLVHPACRRATRPAVGLDLHRRHDSCAGVVAAWPFPARTRRWHGRTRSAPERLPGRTARSDGIVGASGLAGSARRRPPRPPSGPATTPGHSSACAQRSASIPPPTAQGKRTQRCSHDGVPGRRWTRRPGSAHGAGSTTAGTSRCRDP